MHVSTLGTIPAGLRAAAEGGLLDASRTEAARAAAALIQERTAAEGVFDGHLVKWLGSTSVDGSLLSLISPLGVVAASTPLATATVLAVEQEITVDDGVHRYLEDTYFGGGQWPLLSCFLGLAHCAAGRTDRAHELLHWVAGTADAAGNLPEQVTQHLLAPSFERQWIDRWGPSASPLLWSHAMFLLLAVELGYAWDRA